MGYQTALVVGAGIAGLAMARALAEKGYGVTVLERSGWAVGASVRNFGMVWPIGQPSGELYDSAMRSREIWLSVAGSAGIFHDPVGSLHLAYHNDEAAVLQELHEIYGGERRVELLDREQVSVRSAAAVTDGLICGLYSPTELIVDPREAIREIPSFLAEKYGIEFHWNTAVLSVTDQVAFTAEREWEADLIVVCSGPDIEILYPEIFKGFDISICKLQMLRMASQPDGWRIGPSLCGGLSLVHYHSFRAATQLETLKNRYREEMGEYLDRGIHVMVSQNGEGELTIGDSHEYGHTHDPFNKSVINDMILDYLSKFARFRDSRIVETWHGFYPKLHHGDPYIFSNPEDGVYLFNGLGGAGMTLAFGLAERLVEDF